jgi:gamma-glutamylputrescine oxidase
VSVFEQANCQHIDSYYAATAGGSPEFLTLTNDIEAEICIVGGGFAGLSAAIELAEKGHDVVLLEAVKMGWAASGRNGGQIIGDWHYSYDELQNMFGYDTAKMFAAFSEEGKQIIYDRADQFNIDADFKKGYLAVAMNKSHSAHFEGYLAEGDKWNYPHQRKIISQQDIKQYVDSDAYIAGVLDEGNGHFHPLKMAIGETKAAVSLGVRIFENSPAITIKGGDEPIVTTAHGKVKAKQVIVAGNCYLEKAAPELEKKIMPAGTYIIATEPLGETRARSLLPQGQAVCDMRHILDYFRVTSDHRLLFGGKTIYNGKDPKDIGKAMLKDMLKVFPQLAGVKVDYAWGGHIDLAVNRMPHVGEYQENVYFVQGFSGHGVVATHIAGRVLAEKVMGKSERYDVWRQIKHHTFPGGTLLRKPGYLAGSSLYYLRDMWDQFKG